MPHYRIEREQIAAGTPPIRCHYAWQDGCFEAATWRVGCGPEVRYYCGSHEGPPCGGVFLGGFVITADTTREELVGVFGCGSLRIHSALGRDVHDLWCCACGEWVGDTQAPDIAHVSIPLQAECLPGRSRGNNELPCRVCEDTLAAAPTTTVHEAPQ